MPEEERDEEELLKRELDEELKTATIAELEIPPLVLEDDDDDAPAIGLDELDLSRKTIVLFTSDHGYMIGHHGLQHKGNANWIAGGVQGPRRPNMFEESIRVPLLVRWPGVVQPGTVISDTVSSIDTLASVLGMLGVPLPDGAKQQGVDFSPLLRGKRIPARDALVGQYDLHNGALAYMRMIRTDEWKLVRFYRNNLLDELYDLRADPGEMINRYEDISVNDVRDRLQERLEAWMRSIDDPLLREEKDVTPINQRRTVEKKP